MWAYSPQNWYFLVKKIATKGYIPLTDFTKFGMGEGLPDLHPCAKFFRCGLKNVGLEPPKLVIFDIYLPERGISP